MITTGSAERGQPDWYERIRTDTMTLIESSGFAEYFSAQDGQPCGGDTFTWTAAIWLAFHAGNSPPAPGSPIRNLQLR